MISSGALEMGAESYGFLHQLKKIDIFATTFCDVTSGFYISVDACATAFCILTPGIVLKFSVLYSVAIPLVRCGFSEKFEKLRHLPRPGLEPTTMRKSEKLSNKTQRTSGIATV